MDFIALSDEVIDTMHPEDLRALVRRQNSIIAELQKDVDVLMGRLVTSHTQPPPQPRNRRSSSRASNGHESASVSASSTAATTQRGRATQSIGLPATPKGMLLALRSGGSSQRVLHEATARQGASGRAGSRTSSPKPFQSPRVLDSPIKPRSNKATEARINLVRSVSPPVFRQRSPSTDSTNIPLTTRMLTASSSRKQS
jgi:hypothetical protein